MVVESCLVRLVLARVQVPPSLLKYFIMKVEIELTTEQIRKFVGRVKLYKFKYETDLGMNYKSIIAKDFDEAKEKMKLLFGVDWTTLVSTNEYIFF